MNNKYLDLKNIESIKKYRSNNEKEYNYIYRISNYLTKIGHSLQKDNGTSLDFYVLSMLSELELSFQSIIILFERGLLEDAHILIRSFIDKIIRIDYSMKSDTNYLELVSNSEKSKKKLCEYVIDNKSKFNAELIEKYIERKEEIKKYLSSLPKEVVKKRLVSEQMCKDINISELYYPYMYYSSYTHGDLLHLNNRIICYNDTTIINLNPIYSDIMKEIELLLELLKCVIEPICKHYEMDSLNLEFEELYSDIKKNN